MAADDLSQLPELEKAAEQAAAQAKTKRIQGWKEWARNHQGRKPLYNKAKRVALPVAEETLSWGDPQAPLHIPARVARADVEWSALWGRGQPPDPMCPGRRKPIAGQDIARVLRRARGKAMGPAQWQMSELRALPAVFHVGLARIFNHAERRGRWPSELRHVTVALLTKEGATHEGQLRPIGLTPVLYRLYTAARGGSLNAWRQALAGGPSRGAIELAPCTLR